MIIFSGIGALAGAILGLWFGPWVLGPAILITTAITAVSGVADGAGPVALALKVTLAVASVQLSYLAGCILRAMVATKIALPTRRL